MISEDVLFIGACLTNATQMVCATIAKNEKGFNESQTRLANIVGTMSKAMAENDTLDT